VGRTVIELLRIVLIGLAAGWIAGRLTKGKGFGLLGDLAIGIIGALLGGLVFRVLGIMATNLLGRLVSATAGAVILLVLLRSVRK
jgi:uncharacterized membrane protein YeaQ/YmgE (transglycosylase-associated protein family)